MYIPIKLVYNIHKLNKIRKLKYGWDGYCANPIDISIVRDVKSILTKLVKQPEIFPTANSTIQLEFNGLNSSYLEIEVGLNKRIHILEIDEDGNELCKMASFNLDNINNVIKNFYKTNNKED